MLNAGERNCLVQQISFLFLIASTNPSSSAIVLTFKVQSKDTHNTIKLNFALAWHVTDQCQRWKILTIRGDEGWPQRFFLHLCSQCVHSVMEPAEDFLLLYSCTWGCELHMSTFSVLFRFGRPVDEKTGV